MTAPRLPEVEALVEDLSEDIVRTPPDVGAAWGVDGPATAGKSVALRMVAERLRQRGLVPLLAAPPAGALDAGPLALIELAAGMKDAGLRNGDTALLCESDRPLADKVDKLRSWIEHDRERIVLLFDDPIEWPNQSEETEHFADHARVVIQELVRDARCRRVVSGRRLDGMRYQALHRVEIGSESEDFLNDPGTWGELADAAGSLATLGIDRLGGFSPLELRLLVAQSAIESVDGVSAWLATASLRSRRAISHRLIDALVRRGELHDLLDAWARLAHVRRPFSEQLLDAMVDGIDPFSDALLRHCLLYRLDGEYVLHETLRRDVLEQVDEERRPETPAQLRLLAGHYDAIHREASASGAGAGLVAAMEGFYYAARAGERDLLHDRAFFVDQLDLLGKTLSYERRDYEAAAEVFAEAVRLDDADDYAHHYLAYNLDLRGEEPSAVERHYRRAIELNERHVWWRARYVQFLVTRGRTADARNEWDRSLDELLTVDRSENVRFYETLHGWVADALLRRGLLDFADAVVSEVPYPVRRESPRITALVQRLRTLQLTDREGAFVPAQHLAEGWWSEGPFLLQRRAGEPPLLLRRWLAGRIEHLTRDEVELRVCEMVPQQAERPRVASMRIPTARFDELSQDDPASDLQPGRFVEVGLYSDEHGKKPVRLIRVHPQREWIDDTLSAPAARGDRYWADKTVD